jgi:hypothetical protein
MKVRRQDNQTLLDVAIQYCGDAAAAFDIALLNDLSLTDDTFDEVLLSAPVNKRIVEYYSNNNINPATSGEETILIITHNHEQLITREGERIITRG